MDYQKSVEKWGVWEVSCAGTAEGNPFTGQWIRAIFTGKSETVEADGFYDGDGVYKVRFMPSFTGEYRFCLQASFLAQKQEGTFWVTEPASGNHGPVRVANTWHFAYEDGVPYYPVGTTCYVWELQPDERIAQTLTGLQESGFNKIRFCIFPKHYDYNLGEPRSYPYEGTPMDCGVLTRDNFMQYTGKTEGNHWDFERFCTAHFAHIEACVEKLQKIGVEADLILMHPYDRWGFAQMDEAQDDLYIRYVVARLAAYRNVWWSLANEYDLMEHKTIQDWERFASIICQKDPYRHLRSIHNCMAFYDHARPWITHCSIQRQDLYKSAELVTEWRTRYRKPVVLDEIAYEGNIEHGWGNITGKEMVRRFWEAACRGGYPGHGETFLAKDDVLWWSHGGILHGESWKRVRFLLRILKETPGIGLVEKQRSWDEVCAVPQNFMEAERTGYHLFYYSFMRPSFRKFYFDDVHAYKVEVIDTWNMTVEEVGTFTGSFRVELSGRQYMAVRIQKV